MRRKISRTLLPALAAGAAMLVAAPLVLASHDGGSWSGGSGGSYGDRDQEPRYAVSYINPDVGQPSQNPNIRTDSSCANPDRYDEFQALSAPGSRARNVHNDACLFGRDSREASNGGRSGEKVDDQATYEAFGVGYISACPDPDNAGPKTARTMDKDGDGRADVCIQTGYQEKNMAGDKEFHARMNANTDRDQPGDQTVVWCYDPDANGCADESVKDTINISWGARRTP